jgi:hypothetical protein
MGKGKDFKKTQSKKTKHFQEPEKDTTDYDTFPPTFSFHHMKYGGSYCVSQCSPDDRSDLIHQIVMMSQKTWKDLTSINRKSFGYEHIPIQQFRAKTFPKIVTPDIQRLMVFSFSHGGRMAGVRTNDMFHVVFVGINIYNH